jgi:hypothetical protein
MPRDRHREHLQRQLAEAGRELDAARKPSEIRAAARRRRIALEVLEQLDAEEKPKRPTTRGRRPAS